MGNPHHDDKTGRFTSKGSGSGGGFKQTNAPKGSLLDEIQSGKKSGGGGGGSSKAKKKDWRMPGGSASNSSDKAIATLKRAGVSSAGIDTVGIYISKSVVKSFKTGPARKKAIKDSARRLRRQETMRKKKEASKRPFDHGPDYLRVESARSKDKP